MKGESRKRGNEKEKRREGVYTAMIKKGRKEWREK